MTKRPIKPPKRNVILILIEYGKKNVKIVARENKPIKVWEIL